MHDCAVSERCVNKECSGPTAGTGLVGDSCNADGDCTSGLACNPLAIGFPSGYCSADCSASGTCASGGQCTTLSSGSKVCASTCAADADCRKDYVCCATEGNVCVPSASCTPAACTRPVVASALPAAQVIPLGTHKVGDTVSFDVPANTGSITIVHQAKIAGLTVESGGNLFDNSAVPLTIHKPDNSIAYDDTVSATSSPDGGTDMSGQYAMFGGGQGSTAAFTIPNTSASLSQGVPAGTWKFVVNDYANECGSGVVGCSDGGSTDDTYDVSVLVRPLPGGTALNVNFYIVADVNIPGTSTPLSASNAASNASVKRMVSTFKSIYSGAGVTSVNVNFYDVPAAARAEYGTNVSADETGPCDLLDQMFTLSGANPANSINLFLVQSIRQSSTNTNAGTVVGVDGSIPGPATLSGTVHSGAAVSLADLFSSVLNGCGGPVNLGGCGADRTAYIAAHETGHFLGLFHTTEMEGSDFDPLGDTAKCPCLPCAASSDQSKCGQSSAFGQALVPADRCTGTTCGGGDNLMFWLLDDAVSQGKLTAQQGKVIQLNPAVQ